MESSTLKQQSLFRLATRFGCLKTWSNTHVPAQPPSPLHTTISSHPFHPPPPHAARCPVRWSGVVLPGRSCPPDGHPLDERATLKLDPDQRRTAWLEAHAEWEKCLLVSESGMFALLVHHYVPENRTLRQWMTHQVLPELHQQQHAAHDDRPSLSRLNWMGNSLHLLHWRNESWVRWQDVPQAVLELPASRRGWWQRMVGKVLNKGEALRIG